MTSGRWDEGALLVRTYPKVNVRRYRLACPYCERKCFVVLTPGTRGKVRHICRNCWQVFGATFDTSKDMMATRRLGDDQRRSPLTGTHPLV